MQMKKLYDHAKKTQKKGIRTRFLGVFQQDLEKIFVDFWTYSSDRKHVVKS